MGTGRIYPNMYVILTGPPAVRKSTAFLIMTKLLRRYTNVRFAPDDTSGQRQGLIAAMTSASNKDDDDEKKIIEALSSVVKQEKSGHGNTSLGDLQADLAEVGNLRLDTRDPYTLFIAASELNSILGEGNTALLTFLQKMYDGDPYNYQLKNTSVELNDALLGMIGATTPSQLAIAMPAEAVGQGFTSRAIFVYADKRAVRKIARPKLDVTAEEQLGEIYSKVFYEFEGAFAEDPVAATMLDNLYERGITITDPRFVHYTERRHTHLQKLFLALAASRGDKTIRTIDVNFADQLLLYTEQTMADALGEYGMSKLSAAKQRLLDYIQSSNEPIPTKFLYYFMSRDMSQLDFKHTIVELHNAGKISQITLDSLGPCIIAVSDSKVRKAKGQLAQIEEMLVARKAN